MNLSFVSLLATDKVVLPALFYEPQKPSKKAVVWLHGMGDNATFYKPHFINPIGQALADKGISLLALNNRGAHNKKTLKLADDTLPEEDQRFQGGTYFELISDCVKDIDGAADFLKQKGYTTLYLLGHSTGANKICAYHVRAKQNPFSKYVLAGPGDDTGLMFGNLGEKKFWKALSYAAKFAKTEPLRIMPKYTGMYPYSTQSAWDILNPDGDYNTFPYFEYVAERLGKKRLFDEYQKIDLPTMVIIGEEDEFTYGIGGAAKALNIFMDHTSNAMLKKTDFHIVHGADHGFRGVEEDFAKQVADWLVYA